MNKENGADSKARHPEEKVFWIIGLGLLTIALVPAVFILVFHSLEWGGPTDWATFATYFSGVATPVVALCSALLFYQSIIVQRDEFEKTRKEMESAKTHQIDVEQTRNKLIRQEQIERALPHARELQKSLFRNLNRYDPKSADLSEREELDEKMGWYISRSTNIIAMLNEYLDCGGDIYLILNEISDIYAEHGQFHNMFKGSQLDEMPSVHTYQQLIKSLHEKRAAELDRYAIQSGHDELK